MSQGKYELEFRAGFERWRPGKAQAEQAYINTAMLINNFINGKQLTQITQDFEEARSPDYIALNKDNKLASATILYGLLVVDGYSQEVNPLSEIERHVLQEILESLNGLYDKPTKDCQIKFDCILNNADIWLDECLSNHHDEVRVKEFCSALFTMGKLIHINLSSLGRIQRAVAGKYMNLGEVQQRLDHLLTKIKEKVAHFDIRNSASEQDAGIIVSSEGKSFSQEDNTLVSTENQITIESYLDSRCVSILNQPDIELPEKLIQMHVEIETTRDNLTQLMYTKEAQPSLLETFKEFTTHTEFILQGLKENDDKVNGPVDIAELIKSNQAHFDFLLSQANDEVRSDWGSRLEKINQQRHSESTPLTLANAAVFPLIAAYRFFSPKGAQIDLIDNVATTLYGESKLKLIALAEDTIAVLKKVIDEANEEVNVLSRELAGGNPLISKLFFEAPPEKLKTLLESSCAACKQMSVYDGFIKEINYNQMPLETLAQKELEAKTYVDSHRSLSSRFVHFVSKSLPTPFKKEQDVSYKEMKKELLKIQRKMKNYRAKLDDIMKRIDENMDISEVNKVDFRNQILMGSPSVVKPLTRENLNQIKDDRVLDSNSKLSR